MSSGVQYNGDFQGVGVAFRPVVVVVYSCWQTHGLVPVFAAAIRTSHSHTDAQPLAGTRTHLRSTCTAPPHPHRSDAGPPRCRCRAPVQPYVSHGHRGTHPCTRHAAVPYMHRLPQAPGTRDMPCMDACTHVLCTHKWGLGMYIYTHG